MHHPLLKAWCLSTWGITMSNAQTIQSALTRGRCCDPGHLSVLIGVLHNLIIQQDKQGNVIQCDQETLNELKSVTEDALLFILRGMYGVSECTLTDAIQASDIHPGEGQIADVGYLLSDLSLAALKLTELKSDLEKVRPAFAMDGQEGQGHE
jgi:hypothetical protein